MTATHDDPAANETHFFHSLLIYNLAVLIYTSIIILLCVYSIYQLFFKRYLSTQNITSSLCNFITGTLQTHMILYHTYLYWQYDLLLFLINNSNFHSFITEIFAQKLIIKIL